MKKIRKTVDGIGWMEYEIEESLEQGQVFAFIILMLGVSILVGYGIFRIACWSGF